MNELYLICILIICIITIYLSNKPKDKIGLKAIFYISNILSFILSFKYVNVSTINFNSNAITYVTMLTALYLLLESIGKKEVGKLIVSNLIINIFSAGMFYITASYTQSLNDTVAINMSNVFLRNYRVLIAFPIAIFISQKLLVTIYSKVKKIYDNLFISMTTTYLAIGLIDAIIFSTIAYYNILSIKILIKLLLSTYMSRLLITVAYSLFLIVTNKKKVKKWAIYLIL